MLTFGIISEVDAVKGLARVAFPDKDNIVSAFIPMSVPLTLNDKFSLPFFVNEHVWCLMDENLEYGVIGGAIYSTADTPGNIGNANTVGVQFAQGLRIDYSRSNKTLSVSGSGKVLVNTSDDVTITSAKNVEVTATEKAKITATSDVEITSAAKIKATATTEIDITAPVIKLNGAAITLTGAVQVVGAITAGGISVQTGLGGGTGKMTGDGDIETTGTIKGAIVLQGTVELGTHQHSGVTTGGGVSGPPVP